jgi:hypothetical protein
MQVSINIRQRMNRVVPLFGLDKGGQVRCPLALSPPLHPPAERGASCRSPTDDCPRACSMYVSVCVYLSL